MQHLGYDVAHWQAPMAYFHCCQHWYRCKLSPWACSSLRALHVGTELLKLPGVVLLHLICLGFLYSFSLPGFHFSAELQHYGLYSLLKKPLERCQESKWEHKFCILKDREIIRDGPTVLHYVELFPFFSSGHYRSSSTGLCESRSILSPVSGFSIYSQLCFSMQKSVACVKWVMFVWDAHRRIVQA